MTDSPTDFDEDLEDASTEENAAPVTGGRRRVRPRADEALVEAAFETALSAEGMRRLRHAKGRAGVIVVPSASWIVPTKAWLATVFGDRLKIAVGETTRVAFGRLGRGSSADVATWLSTGHCVYGVTTDPTLLPSNLVAAADETIRLDGNASETLRRAIARFTGRPLAAVPTTVVAGLDLEHVVAAMRPGSGPRRIVQRLELAATRAFSSAGAGDDVPDLEDAIEYGKAREWGLGLANGVKLYRDGLIALKDLPRGVVLHGPPGTGKSLFSRVLAKKCNLPLFTTSVADWFTNRGTYDDVIRTFGSVMDQAAAKGQAIVFIDELDSLPNRYLLTDSRNSDYWKPLCNYVLTRLDNAVSSTRSGVVVIGATNDLGAIDPALLRPGRLELAIEIGHPDRAGTASILRFHAPELDEAEVERVAAMAEGRTGAELMFVVREGRRLARDAGRPLEAEDLLRVIVPPLAIGPATLRLVSIHEAGHAVATLALGYESIRQVVVGANGGRGGHAVSEAHADQAVTRGFIEARATVLLAGRAAERMVLREVSTGAGGDNGDLAIATRMLAAMHANAGLGQTLAYLAPADRPLQAMAYPEIRLAVERDMQRLQRRADRLVVRYRRALEAIAEALATRRQLDGTEVEALFAVNRPGRLGPERS